MSKRYFHCTVVCVCVLLVSTFTGLYSSLCSILYTGPVCVEADTQRDRISDSRTGWLVSLQSCSHIPFPASSYVGLLCQACGHASDSSTTKDC